MRRALIPLLALACGLTVANLYYSQPLLDLIADAFGVSEGAATVVVTLTQIGYALGLLLLLPLGDLVENRKLTTRLLVGTAVSLLVAALAPAYPIFLIFSVLIGTTSVVAQILVPFAAHLAPPEERGSIVGKVMGGLLLGILLARTVSSFVGGLWGWRAIFFISAALMIVLAGLMWRLLPPRQPEHTAGYLSLLRTVWDLAVSEPALRRRAICQALLFGAFSAYWTAIAYELIGAHGFNQSQIAIFALIGAGGAAAAPIAGKIADRGYGSWASGGALLLAALMAVLAAVGQHSVILLGLAGVLLDFAVQAHAVMSQHEIYALRPDARARVNTVFMTTIFTVGAISSAVTGLLHDRYGWTGACVLAAALALAGFVVWAVARWRAAVPVRELTGQP